MIDGGPTIVIIIVYYICILCMFARSAFLFETTIIGAFISLLIMIDGGPTIVIIIVYYILYCVYVCSVAFFYILRGVYLLFGGKFMDYMESVRDKNGVNSYLINKGGLSLLHVF